MRTRHFPDTYVIIFTLVIICAIATWIVPGGEYATTADGAVTFRQTDHVPQTWQVFSAFLAGFVRQAPIIVFVLVIGGAFQIINDSRAVEVGIRSFLGWSERLEHCAILRRIGVNNVLMTMIMLIFSLFGAVFGMSEETIAFTLILVPLAISMGYDSITGVCLVYVAAHVGFSGAFLNPFTVGIAQNLAGIPLFSGMGYRFICWCILNVLLIVFALSYAGKVKADPESSPMYEADVWWRSQVAPGGPVTGCTRSTGAWLSFGICSAAVIAFSIACSAGCTLTLGGSGVNLPWLLPVISGLFIIVSLLSLKKNVHFYVLSLLGFAMVYLVTGVLAYGWYLPEISALFLAMAIAAGMAVGLNADGIVKGLLSGAKDILSAALVIGLASGIVIILQDGKIMDTILHALETGLGSSGRLAALSGMYGLETLINLVMPSATAKAAITMPILGPFSDLVGVSRQATVLAFQFGDGFTNMLTPTSGVLIAVLACARIPYAVWVKWVWRFIVLLIVLGFLLLIPTLVMEIPGFA